MKRDEVRKIGYLARVGLSDTECDVLAGQFDAILSYIQKLNELQLDSVQPASHPFDLVNVFRDDVVQPTPGAKKLMENAPDSSKDMYRVPKIIEAKGTSKNS